MEAMAGSNSQQQFPDTSGDAGRRQRVLRWSISRKWTVAFVVIIVITVAVGAVGLVQVLDIKQSLEEVQALERQQTRSLELMTAGQKLVGALDRMVLTQDPSLASTEVAAALGQMKFYIQALQTSEPEWVATTGEEVIILLDDIQRAYDDLRRAVDDVDLLARQERWEEANTVLSEECRPANEQMGRLTRRLVRQAEADADRSAQRAQQVVWQATVLLSVLVVFVILAVIGWRQVISYLLIRPVAQLRQGVLRVTSGDLEHEIDIRTGDEIEELADEFNKMARFLRETIGSLERRVNDRTRDLQAVADVGRATTSVLDPDELLGKVVDLVRERFDLYYVGLFLLDESGRYAVLRAGTGEAGREMLARHHRLEVGGNSMIGQCVALGEARIALDVGEEAVHFDNPLLPETRSELALPLRSRGRTIGAMTVQSDREAAFDEADIAILQAMADQVAIAIDNARLFADTQAALEELRAAQQRYLRQAWEHYLRAAESSYYEARRSDMPALADRALAEADSVVERQEVVVKTPSSAEEHSSAVIVPISLRGVVIGALGVHDEYGERQWDENDIAIIQAVAERMALAADNLRLLYETQRRAYREQLTREIADRMRRAADMSTLLRTAVQAAAEALGSTETFVQLQMPEE